MAKQMLDVTLDLSAEIKPLVHKLSLSLGAEKLGVIFTFIAARSGEGTSTVAQSFAHAFGVETGKRVLLIETGPGKEDGKQGLVELAVAGADVSAALSDFGMGVVSARWNVSLQGKAMSARMIQDKAFWQSLREHFDVIVIDAPALQVSAEGTAFAQVAHQSVLVVEAENTRKELVENLRDALIEARATIAGVVMNKRKFYIPEKVYKRL